MRQRRTLGPEATEAGLRILLVEDDELIGGAVRDHMRAEGHAVDWAANITDARAHANVVSYGLVLLDLQLPDGHGLDFLREMRKRSDATPVIVLTARDQISHRIDGLNAGADDYLVKPFDLGELSARVHAVARRSAASPDPVLTLGSVEIRGAERIALCEGRPVELTAREWALIDCLSARQGAIVSKAQIEDALYAFGSEVESNAVEVYVSRLRKKLGRNAITTVRGVGYRMERS